jgi:hypothetical protein
MKNKKERIKKLEARIKKWDELSKNNPNNIHNLSTSERQDWVDELIEIKNGR